MAAQRQQPAASAAHTPVGRMPPVRLQAAGRPCACRHPCPRGTHAARSPSPSRLAGRAQALSLPSQSERTTMRPRRPQSPWPLPPRLSCRPLHPLCALASGRSGGCSRSVSGGGCRRGMSVSSGGGRSAGAACAVVKHVVLAVVHMLVTLCQRAFYS